MPNFVYVPHSLIADKNLSVRRVLHTLYNVKAVDFLDVLEMNSYGRTSTALNFVYKSDRLMVVGHCC